MLRWPKPITSCLVSKIVSRTREVIVHMYSELARQYLEYCVQLLAPHYRKDIKILEHVQRRVMKLLKRQKKKTHE